jgi:nitrite reductase/ring-hydroxylating ferredoxin subunit
MSDASLVASGLQARSADVFLCRRDDLPEGGSLAVTAMVAEGAPAETVLLARREGEVHAWLDRCPHTGLSLRWDPRPFVTGNGRFLECASHRALFRVEDGVCVRGPCKGEGLTARPVESRDGAVWLRVLSPDSEGP